MRGHDGIPKRMPESSYSCYCLQKKHENKNEKALSTILCKCKRDSVISSLISGFCFQK